MIVPWPTISRGTEAIVPMPPGLVSEMFAPTRSSADSVFVRALSISVVEGRLEVGEREPAGVADHRHHQRARAVLLLDVDGDAEVHAAVVDAVRLAVALLEVMRHHRHLARSPALAIA